MNFKLTVTITIVLMLALIAYLYATRTNVASTQPASSVSALFTPKPSEIVSIAFSRYKQERVKFVKEGEQWKLVNPVKADADNNQLSSIASTLQNLNFVQKFAPEDNNGPKSPTYTGTADPMFTIAFSDKDKHDYTLSIGKRNSQGGVFVTVGGDKTIFVLSDNPATDLDKNPNTFRNMQIVQIDQPSVTGVALKAHENAWQLGKSGDKWLVTQPVTARANQAVVDEILREVQNVRATAFSSLTRKAAGLEPPEATVTITSTDTAAPVSTAPSTASAPAKPTKTTVLQLGYASEMSIDKKDSPVFASVEGSSSVFVLAGPAAKTLLKELRDVRDAAVTPLSLINATDFTVSNADGKTTLAASKKDATWNLTTPLAIKAEPLAISDYLNTVHNLMAIKYVDGAGDLKAMGLDPAQTKLELTLPGQSQHEVILLGTPTTDPEKGKITPAMRQGETTVFLLASTDTDKLAPDVLKLRNKEIATFDAMKIRGIDISGPKATAGLTTPAPATAPSTGPATAPATAPATGLAAIPGIALEREGTHWNARKDSTTLLADDSKMSEILAQFSPLLATRYLDQAPPTGTPDVTVTLTVVEPVTPPATAPAAATAPASAPATMPTTMPATAAATTPATAPNINDLLPVAVGPEQGKLVTRTLRLYKITAPASAPATAPTTAPATEPAAATWKAVWDQQSPAWAFEPNSLLIEAVTKESYATLAPAATAPATTQAATTTKP